MQTITMRPLHQGDGAFLRSIFKDNAEYYAIFYDPEDRISAWEERVAHFTVQSQVHHQIIETDHTPIGWMSFSQLSQTEWELDILVLHKAYLHQSYGTAAISHFLQLCRNERVKTVTLNVNQSNTRAIRFYEKFGFQIIAEEIVPECNDAVNLAQYKMQLALQ